MNQKQTLGVVSALLVGVSAAWLAAGPLNPPPGPVGSTYKTLSEVEPRVAINLANTPGDPSSLYRITQPGSYYLTGNVNGVVGKGGIVVAANDVTIDLNGFSVVGPGSGTDFGINVLQGEKFAIRNGGVRSWGGTGLICGRIGCEVDHVSVTGNGGVGITLGSESRIKDCVASGNGQHGIEGLNACSVLDCTTMRNGTSAVGGAGISVSTGSFVSRCTSRFNSHAGISASQSCKVENCVSIANGTNGIESLIGKVLVSGCTASDNALDGINVGPWSTVSNNICGSNEDDAIQVDDNCVVTGNNCAANGPSASGCGVFVAGLSCRIEDNHLEGNHYGVLALGGAVSNFIVRNTARANSINFSVSAGNEFAPVITNPGNTFTGATPWSNFAF